MTNVYFTCGMTDIQLIWVMKQRLYGQSNIFFYEFAALYF